MYPPIEPYDSGMLDVGDGHHQRAADEWTAWDHTQSGTKPVRKFDDPAVRLQFARLVTHYWRSAAFLDDGQLLRDAAVLDGIPGALITGAHDVSCPPDIAWELSRRWTTAELDIIDANHLATARSRTRCRLDP